MTKKIYDSEKKPIDIGNSKGFIIGSFLDKSKSYRIIVKELDN